MKRSFDSPRVLALSETSPTIGRMSEDVPSLRGRIQTLEQDVTALLDEMYAEAFRSPEGDGVPDREKQLEEDAFNAVLLNLHRWSKLSDEELDAVRRRNSR